MGRGASTGAGSGADACGEAGSGAEICPGVEDGSGVEISSGAEANSGIEADAGVKTRSGSDASGSDNFASGASGDGTSAGSSMRAGISALTKGSSISPKGIDVCTNVFSGALAGLGAGMGSGCSRGCGGAVLVNGAAGAAGVSRSVVGRLSDLIRTTTPARRPSSRTVCSCSAERLRPDGSPGWGDMPLRGGACGSSAMGKSNAIWENSFFIGGVWSKIVPVHRGPFGLRVKIRRISQNFGYWMRLTLAACRIVQE